MKAPSLLRVRLLGGFQVEGIDERTLGTRKGRSLARRLVAELGRPVPVEELVDVLWGRDPPRNPADQLSVLVSRIRGVLGAARIRRGDGGYRIDVDWVDVLELRTRTREIEDRLATGRVPSAVAAAEEALAVARGPLLPEEDGDWVVELRAVAARDLARARLAAAQAYLAAGEAAAARAAAAPVLEDDAYDEAALRLVMRADAAAGRPALALAAYDAARRRLADELGVDPAPETQALHRALLRGEPVDVARGATVQPLLGRKAELRALDALLSAARAGRASAAVVEGAAGMGKTALLNAWTAGARTSAAVLAGRCDELGRAIPLQPVVDGLAAYLRSMEREAVTGLLGDQRTTLATLLGHPSVPAERPVTVVADSAAARLELFAALVAVLDRMAAGRAIVVVVDDLHAAAPGTAEFLAYFLRRRARALVVASRRPQPGPDVADARRIVLAPLGVEDAVELAGPERGPALYERSRGHPLFLRELAGAPDQTMPATIVDAVRSQTSTLGAASAIVEAAAVLGPPLDVDLLSAITDRPVPRVLDDLERGAAAGVLSLSGGGLAFPHELVREAVAAGVAETRRIALHRAAAAMLAGRSDADPMILATHARLGGESGAAADALTRAAALAADRQEPALAERLLDDAIALQDAAGAHLARGRLRLARLDLDGASEDADAALRLGVGGAGFELAGWARYYGRRYEEALRYADEGARRTADPEVRASCLALGGRVRHTRGELDQADRRLAEAASMAASTIRGVAQVWHGQLLVHRGQPEEGAELARRGLLDPRPAHPFAPLHARFTLAVALAYSGRWADAMDALGELERATARQQDRRFPPVNANLRGWLLRGAGRVEEASELHRQAAGIALGPLFLEPHYAALLDLVEDRLALGDVAGGERALADCRGIMEWRGSMSWRHRDRYLLVRARVAMAGGDLASAADAFAEVAGAAERRGDVRYRWRARLWQGMADARAGRRVDTEELERAVTAFLPVAGPDGWRELAQLASATRSDRWRREAERRVAAIAAAAKGRSEDGDRVAAGLRRQLEAL